AGEGRARQMEALPPFRGRGPQIEVEGPAGTTPEPGAKARRDSARGPVFATLYFGSLAAAAIVLVLAPFLGYRAFERFRAGGPDVGSRYAAAQFWTPIDRKSTRLNSSHVAISYAVFCLKKKKKM